MKIYCCTENRRRLIKTTTELNGIDYLEVVPSDVLSEKQKTLKLFFLKPLTEAIETDQIFISLDGQLSGITAEEVIPDPSEKSITIELSDRGGFSLYTLSLMASWEESEFLEGFDKPLSEVSFSFKAECPTDIDCKTPDDECEPENRIDTPEINYLAKDYRSFRQLLLDRMSFLLPDWTERNAADLGITLVEILAYVGDYLSYRQDAITSEAYLRTARKRISVRRHARMVDYYMHDGLNARVWIQLQISEDMGSATLKREDEEGFVTKFLTGGDLKTTDEAQLTEIVFDKLELKEEIVFEPLYDIDLFHEHNSISFHTYGEADCCLPKGATSATLTGQLDNLKINDVLILEEVLGPNTGNASDADPEKRHAVKLTDIRYDRDFDFSETPASEIDITIIEWNEEDALPFPLCVSAILESEEGNEIYEISVARGNVVLADHGYSYSDQTLLNPAFPFEQVKGSLQPTLVPQSKYHYANSGSAGHCETKTLSPVIARYNPVLQAYPLTQTEPLPLKNNDASELEISASKMRIQNIRKSLPSISLTEVEEQGDTYALKDRKWDVVKDLLVDSSDSDQDFVVETDAMGRSHLRFGNNRNGKRPSEGSKMIAEYRIGNGVSGNVGRNTINRVVFNSDLGITSVTNPLPAIGGKEPETKEEAKQYAPQAFRSQERAVTTSDYEEMAKRCKSDVQSVSAKFRWTGSWQTAFITADRFQGKKVTKEWSEELEACLEQYRLAGVDMAIGAPEYVGLEIALTVCIAPLASKINVRSKLQAVLGNGKKGFFHPDNLIFGQTIYLSKLYAIAQAVEGVVSVDITQFQRFGDNTSKGLSEGKLGFGQNELPRLDNDPNKIDMGILKLQINGGR